MERQLEFTVSIGVATATATDTPESLIHRADAALYGAKSEGRNRVCCEAPEAVEAAAGGDADHASPALATVPLDYPAEVLGDAAIATS